MKVFAVSDYTTYVGHFFDTLESAKEHAVHCNEDNDVQIVEMELEGHEFVPKVWYTSQGKVLEGNNSQTNSEGN